MTDLDGDPIASDIYRDHADAIAEELLAGTELYDPVSDDFAANSDEGYGEWIGPEGDGDGSDTEFDTLVDPYDPASRRNRPLTDSEQENLDALNQVMSATGAQSGLLDSSGRGAYVHQDDDEAGGDEGGVDAAAVDDAGDLLLPSPAPWWKFQWFDHTRWSHRAGAIAACVILFSVIFVAVKPSGKEGGHSAAESTPAYTVPTMTQAPEAPANPPAQEGHADGPVGIKRADSRCTAGSTDPMQAFDNDVNTAWMCVPAYGVPGTVLRVEFDNWYVVTGVAIVPGWNRMNESDGSDEWNKHMTAQVVDYQFNDPDETRLSQETNNIRDEVATVVDPPVLASAMTITIKEFGRPTGPVADVTARPGQPATIVGEEPVTGDLKDFAISSITIIGHRAA